MALTYKDLEEIMKGRLTESKKWKECIEPINFNDEAILSDLHDWHFIKINEIGYSDRMPRREQMENVISSLNIPGCKINYLVKGRGDNVSIYLGIDSSSLQEENLTYLEHVLGSFRGNFHGSKLGSVYDRDSVREIFENIYKLEHCSSIRGVPSVYNRGEEKDIYIQKLNNIVNSMQGSVGEWAFSIVFEPTILEEIDNLEKAAFSFYDNQYKDSRKSVSKSEQESNVSREEVNQDRVTIIKSIDDNVLKPLREGRVRGYFKTAIYTFAKEEQVLNKLKNNLLSVWQGSNEKFYPMQSAIAPADEYSTIELVSGSRVVELPIPIESDREIHPKESLILSRTVFSKEDFEYRTYLTAGELSLICALPSSELPGVSLRMNTDFGLNPLETNGESIKLGSLLNQGEPVDRDLNLDKNMLSRHIFVAGVTGSGKTTTCKRLLQDSALPYLIIEPAKTEYRSLINTDPEVIVYTLGNEENAPFRFNPFELIKGQNISEHVDMLKAAFTAAYPMEAAMPYILEEAIYQSYEDYGWSLDTVAGKAIGNWHSKDPWDPIEKGCYWPTLVDLIRNLKVVVDRKGFDDRLKNDYIGSLVARFDNLLMGSKGKMLNCKVSTDVSSFLDKKVVLELDSLKAQEDKCLLMALVVTRIEECIKLRYLEDDNYRHITLIEEAHRLLEKVAPGEGGSKKQGVAMFSDLLAEVRKYGESLVIVDQIPNKLTPEVLKNTGTKIIHKLFAKDDRVAIGDTACLDDNQKDYLPKLRIGEVIVYSGEWDKPVHARIDPVEENFNADSVEERLKKLFDNQIFNDMHLFYPELGILAEPFDKKDFENYQWFKNFFSNAIDQAAVGTLLGRESKSIDHRVVGVRFVEGVDCNIKELQEVLNDFDSNLISTFVESLVESFILSTTPARMKELRKIKPSVIRVFRVIALGKMKDFKTEDVYHTSDFFSNIIF